MKNRVLNKMMAAAIAVMMAGSLAACGTDAASAVETRVTAETDAGEDVSNAAISETGENADSASATDGTDETFTDFDDVMVGGYSLPDSPVITEDIRKICDKAFEELEGVRYTPIALLGTQVVAGTNYQVLCAAEVVVPDAETEYVVVTIYEDLEGNVEITDIEDLPVESAAK